MFKILLSLLFIVLFCNASFAEDKALERIQKNQEINCGVYVLGSVFSYSPDGKPQGFTADLFNEVSLRTGLKIKYSEISSFATLFEDLKTGHFDMVCAPVLLIPATAMKGIPGTFISEDPINIYGDAKADYSDITSIDQLNNEKYTFVGMDGELGGLYVPKLFPKAKLNLLALGTPVSNMLMEVHTQKANFLIFSKLAFKAYNAQNPGKIKQVTHSSIQHSSIRLFFPEGSETLSANMDAIIEDMKRDGTLDKLLKKNGLSS
ncbi:MAG: transporter substrate-binding domain-containing protein [Pseudomonadota bacterium]